jgi:polyhydroxybutyrate depolymerase
VCAIVTAIAVASCRTNPAPSAEHGDERVGSAAVAPAPSAGCRAGDLAALVGERRQLLIDGEPRSYLIDAAAGSADVPRPLVLAFHGFRHSAAGLRSMIGLAERAATGAFVAIHPEGRDDVSLLNSVGRGWDTGPDETRDLAFVRALLDAIERERCIDRRRLFVTGFSNGGFIANLLGCRLADRLAAVAPVAGARALDTCEPAAPLPILFFHGATDQVVPPRLTVAARAWWRRANQCRDGDELREGCRIARDCAADVVLCEGPQAHTWPPDATRRIWEFFATHPRLELPP